jgi:hypothetical protein
MNLARLLESLRRQLKTIVFVCYGVLTLVVVADVIRLLSARGHEAVPAEHGEQVAEHAAGFWASAYHLAENMPGFWTLFGFLGCLLLVLVSKTYGHSGVSVREDYYSE